jgi:very-short-patch-repair endonuclease
MKNGFTKLARLLRKQQTISEGLIWQKIRNRKINNKKVVRQQPIIFEYNGKNRVFVADFYCHECKIVIEIDGKIHEEQKEYDEYREYIINKLGFRVVRITNEEIKEGLEEVIERIATEILTPGC